MTAKVYGKPDEDQTAQNLLGELISGLEVEYLVLRPRIPIDARPCQLPGSITLSAKVKGSGFITVRQNKPGGSARRIN